MNILIKLTCLIGLVIAPILGAGHAEEATGKVATCCVAEGKCTSMTKEECEAKGCTNATCEHMTAAVTVTDTVAAGTTVSKEISIEKENVNGKVIATVKTTVDGKETVEKFEGTDAEVQAKIDEAKKK